MNGFALELIPVELGPRNSISTFDHWTTASVVEVGEETGVTVGGGIVLVIVGEGAGGEAAEVDVSDAVGEVVDSGVGEVEAVAVKLGAGVTVDVRTIVAEGSGVAVGRAVAVDVGKAVLDGVTVGVADGARNMFTVT